MMKKKRQLYRAAVTFYLILFIVAILWGTYVLISYNYAFWGGLIIEIVGGISGFIGFGSILNPDKIGKFAVGLFGKLLKNYEESEGINRQTQTLTKASGNQVMVNGSKNIIQLDSHKSKQVDTKQKAEKLVEKAKVFSCPNGHEYFAYPPDDNHTVASIEEQIAKDNAAGTIITRLCKCEKRGCKSEFTLYWYRQKLEVSHGKSLFA